MWTIKSKVLRRLRIEKLWSVEELAKRSGVSVRSIRAYEARDTTVRPDSMQCLAKALGAEPTELGRVHDPSATRSNGAGASSRTAIAASPSMTSVTKLPPPSRMEELVEIEREVAPLPPLDTPSGAVAAFTVKSFQDIFTAYKMFEGERFWLEGVIKAQRGISDAEAEMLGTESGVGARFHIVKEVKPGHAVGITVHTREGTHTRHLQKRVGERARIVFSVKRATNGANDAEPRGFAFFMSERARPWALVIDDVLDGSSAARAARKKSIRNA